MESEVTQTYDTGVDLEVEKDKRLPTKTTIKKEEGKYFSRQVERERERGGRWGEREREHKYG